MDRKEAENIAETIWNITERTIKHFIQLSKKCGMEDEFIEHSLIQMIATSFEEIQAEKEEH